MITWALGATFTIPATGTSSQATFVDVTNMWPGMLLSFEQPSAFAVCEVISVNQSSKTANLLNRAVSTAVSYPYLYAFPSGTIVTCLGSGLGGTIGMFYPYANIPYSTTYPAFNTRGGLGLPTLDCPVSVETDCLFSGIMPRDAVLVNGVTTDIRWSAHTATTGNVVWQVQFQRLNASIATAAFDVAYTTVTANIGTVDTVAISSVTQTTLNGTLPGDMFVIMVSRLGGNASDTMSDTAQLLSVHLKSVL